MKPTLIALIITISPLIGYAQATDMLRNKHFNTKNNTALEGYDPVSYFSGKPAKGRKELTTTYNGITYLFLNKSNLEAFKTDPTKYEPAYGGWCAYAMGAKGEKVEVDPETYKITDGKLYLFYNKFFSNTLDDWNKDENSLKKKADTHWTTLFK